jgi:hypothetical protein
MKASVLLSRPTTMENALADGARASKFMFDSKDDQSVLNSAHSQLQHRELL